MPLYYDARGDDLGVAIDDLNERIADKLEELEIDDIDVAQRLERELRRDYHVITAEKRPCSRTSIAPIRPYRRRSMSLRRGMQRSGVLRRKLIERGGWAETPSRRGVSGRYDNVAAA